MRIPRVYYPNPIPLEQEFELTEDAGHHIATVLRIKPNRPIVLFNGDGNEYSAQIISVQRKKVTVEDTPNSAKPSRKLITIRQLRREKLLQYGGELIHYMQYFFD